MVYKCAADDCYAQVDERGGRCDEHSIVEHISPEEYAHLAGILSGAELRDWIGVEVLGYGVREWARKISTGDRTVSHPSVSRQLRTAREKLAEEECEDNRVHIDDLRRLMVELRAEAVDCSGMRADGLHQAANELEQVLEQQGN